MPRNKRANEPSPGKRRALRVLLVEDSVADAMLLVHALERGGFEAITERVETAEAMQAALKKSHWDLILADHAMPHFSAPEALELVKKENLDVPFIIVSGHIDEETAVQAMRAGAHDYIMKDRLARLTPAVERELREAEVRRINRQAQDALRHAQEELELRVQKRTTDLQTTNLKLQNVLEERKRLENELLEIAENERRRIGFDLHDDLGQKLMGVSMMLKALETNLEQKRLPEAATTRNVQDLIGQVINHTHDLAHCISSLDSEGDDLGVLLKKLIATVRRTFPIMC